MICGRNPIPNSTLQFLCHVGDSCIRILSSIPIGRNPGPWGPTTLQAMWYPIHKNAVCPCIRYIIRQSIDTEQVLKLHDIDSFSVCKKGESAFWNVLFSSAPSCIKLIFLWHCQVHLLFTGVLFNCSIFWCITFYSFEFPRETFVHGLSYLWASFFVKLIDTEIVPWRRMILY